MIINLDNTNNELFTTFITKNIEKSLFIKANYEIEQKIVRGIKNSNNQLVGMYLIAYNKYITFLFDNSIVKEDKIKLLIDAQNYQHTEGTIAIHDTSEVEQINEFYNFGMINMLAYFVNNQKIDIENKLEIIKLTDQKDENFLKDYHLKLEAQFNENRKFEDFQQIIKVNDVYALLKNNKIIGGASFTGKKDTPFVITSVFIISEEQNKKYAQRMLRQIMNEPKYQNQHGFIFFNCPIAKKVYQKLGFVVNYKMLQFKKR